MIVLFCEQGKNNMLNLMSNLLRKRLSMPEKHGDILDLMVEELQSENPTIDDKFATDTLSAILFTSFVTLSPNLTLAFKFLSDNPAVLDALKASLHVLGYSTYPCICTVFTLKDLEIQVAFEKGRFNSAIISIVHPLRITDVGMKNDFASGGA